MNIVDQLKVMDSKILKLKMLDRWNFWKYYKTIKRKFA